MKQRQLIIVIGAVAVVLVAVVIATQILGVSPSSGSPYTRYEDVAYSRLGDGGFVLGNPEAPVTLVEFGDFACPHCQEYAVEVERFIDEFVLTGKAKFEYRMFMSAADPTYGPYTARLAECTAEQNEAAFWPAHDILFQMGRAQGRFNAQTARTLADRLDLDYGELLSCAENADQVATDERFGRSLNVGSTPTMMIRYGDSAPQFINDGLRTYDGGGVPYQILSAIVETAQS